MKVTAALLVLLTLAGCAKNIQTKEAVKEAVVAYLTARQEKSGINMSAMNVDISKVTFQADHAMATVAFNLKTGEGGMQMNYDLDRDGNKWVVKGVSGPPTMISPDGGGALPPGHPPTGSKE